MSLCTKIVTALFILQVSLVLVCPKTLRLYRLNPDQDDNDNDNNELNVLQPDEDDDDLTRVSLSRLRVDGPAAAVAQAQDKLLLRRKIQGKQDEEDDETTVRPEIPAIIPGVTKIFNGLLTGSINDILHGAFSFAPRNVSYGINTVYNSVVGLPPPVSTVPPTAATKATVASVATTEAEEEDDNEAGLRL